MYDVKSHFADNRTWCWWNTPGLAFEHVADVGWKRWRVTSATRSIVREDALHAYRHLRSAAFYAEALRILDGSNVRLALGTPIDRVVDEGSHVSLESGSRSFRADTVFDARALVAGSAPSLVQSVRGWFVRVEEPSFDPLEATLMDFRVDQRDDLRFAYVLPFSSTTALIEHAAFSRSPVSRSNHEAALGTFLRTRRGLATWTIEREESGEIPMSATRRPVRISPNVFRIGTAGGAVRASSGFAFVRIQRWSDRIASAIVSGQPIPLAPSRPKFAALDRALLGIMRDHWSMAPEMYVSLFERAPTAALARFMNDASSVADDVRIVGATALGLASSANDARVARIRDRTLVPRAVISA